MSAVSSNNFLPGPVNNPDLSMQTYRTAESSHMQDELSIEDGTLYRVKSCNSEKYRLQSSDGIQGETYGGADTSRFHPYRRQNSAEEFSGLRGVDSLHLSRCPHSFKAVEGPVQTAQCKPDVLPQILAEWAEAGNVGTQCNRLMTADQSYSPDVPEEAKIKPPSYRLPIHQVCNIDPHLTTVSQGSTFPMGLSDGSHYPYQRIAPQSLPESQQSLYPKPIYSYSILIFMALRNSKTGSLPVSEIYNFMTEHFPYFKTAPDGWKNSVRHNLSLNKCFEKVENKNGSSSRKGCLWALNPTKVEKMQEELHKWRRKDPITVRKSMARPEELDRLLGEKSDKYKVSSSAYTSSAHLSNTHLLVQDQPEYQIQSPFPSAHISSQSITYSTNSRSGSISFSQRPHYIPPPPPLQGIGSIHTSRQQISLGQTIHESSHPGSLDSPLLTPTFPAQCVPMQAEYKVCAGQSLKELLPDGDLGSDIDTLNPSLTDLELQENLWEELKDDSLNLDPLVIISTTPFMSAVSPSCLASCPEDIGCSSADLVTPNFEEKPSLSDLHITGIYSTTFANLDSISSGYLSTSGNTTIPLS
ncbi:forkhead box protein N1 [Polypterus senegalus]|nr:forkhead box protein N1 [Polypterus senegalus]